MSSSAWPDEDIFTEERLSRESEPVLKSGVYTRSFSFPSQFRMGQFRIRPPPGGGSAAATEARARAFLCGSAWAVRCRCSAREVAAPTPCRSPHRRPQSRERGKSGCRGRTSEAKRCRMDRRTRGLWRDGEGIPPIVSPWQEPMSASSPGEGCWRYGVAFFRLTPLWRWDNTKRCDVAAVTSPPLFTEC